MRFCGGCDLSWGGGGGCGWGGLGGCGKLAGFFDCGWRVGVCEIRADSLDVAVSRRTARVCVYSVDGGECGAGVFSAGTEVEGRRVFDRLGETLGVVCAGEFGFVWVRGDTAGDKDAVYCV